MLFLREVVAVVILFFSLFFSRCRLSFYVGRLTKTVMRLIVVLLALDALRSKQLLLLVMEDDIPPDAPAVDKFLQAQSYCLHRPADSAVDSVLVSTRYSYGVGQSFLGQTASLAWWLRRPPQERKIPGPNPSSGRIFPGSSQSSDLKIGTPVATLPCAWRYRVSSGTGRPGVSIL